MKAPGFWNHEKPDTIARLLSPIAGIYSIITGCKMVATTAYMAPVPVICIGNYTMGGAGKTPVTQNLYQLTSEMGFKPCVLSRGYGGRITGPKLVEATSDTPEYVGDEPFMMAESLSVVVSRDRKAGADFIAEMGFDLILMDDGFQNPVLNKDICLIVIDGAVMLGNQKVFPAGPLREPLKKGLLRTDALIIIGKPTHKVTDIDQIKRRFTASIKANPENLPTKVIAFCGIGRPEKFRTTLVDCGIEVCELIAFPDHHCYTESDMQTLYMQAKAQGLAMVTTQKDWVKLPRKWQHMIPYLPISLQWDRPEDIKAYLQEKLAKF